MNGTKTIKGLIASSFMLLSLSGYAGHETGKATVDTLEYRKLLKTYEELFNEYSFPNSQARPDGFDLHACLDSIDTRRKEVSQIFHSTTGLNVLKTFMEKERDYVNLIGMLKICLESGLPEGKAILKAYSSCPVKASADLNEEKCRSVAKQAGEYYKAFEKNGP